MGLGGERKRGQRARLGRPRGADQRQIGLPLPGRPRRGHFFVTVSTTSSLMRILRPHSRLVSGGHLLVASRPILLPRPDSGEAKSR